MILSIFGCAYYLFLKKNVVSYMLCEYFLPVYNFLFIFSVMSLDQQFLILRSPNFSFFFSCGNFVLLSRKPLFKSARFFFVCFLLKVL